MIEFRLLRPLELWSAGGALPLGAPKQRALLALLVLRANPVVPRRGVLGEGLELAERAVACASSGDNLTARARVWRALAEVQRARGATAEADAAVEEAIRLYEAKGNVAAASALRLAAATASV